MRGGGWVSGAAADSYGLCSAALFFYCSQLIVNRKILFLDKADDLSLYIFTLFGHSEFIFGEYFPQK